jgi:hypothetical protein
VTAGTHALGELATCTAVAALVFPGSLGNALDRTRAFVCVLGAACAASTKISLVPIAALITTMLVLRLRGAARIYVGAIAGGVWLAIMGPLVIWTYLHTGSPFGAAFAHAFGASVYRADVLQVLIDMRTYSQGGLGDQAWLVVLSLNGASLLLIVAGLVESSRQRRLLLALTTAQVLLIAIALPYQFRFLGGLQYVMLAAGMIGLSHHWSLRLAPGWIAAASLILWGPWLAMELYYARPFVAVDPSIVSREAFLQRYVEFSGDFRSLDQILPRDAKLYVPYDSIRIPTYYAPRPVIFTLADWDRESPLYRFLIYPYGEDYNHPEPLTGLTCADEVYRDSNAVIAAYRTPGRAQERGTVLVQRCTPSPEH